MAAPVLIPSGFRSAAASEQPSGEVTLQPMKYGWS
jgi:hypothetical protein